MYEIFIKGINSYEYDWILSLPRGKSEQGSLRKEENKLIRADLPLDQKKCSTFVSEYFEESQEYIHLSKEEKRNAIAEINGVFETIRNFSVPFICLKSDTSLETICRVFETINSTGTKLSTFDLAVARYHPELKIRDMFNDAKNEYPNLKNYNDFYGENVLYILALCHLRKENKDRIPEATRSVLLSLDNSFIKTNWHEAVGCYAKTLSLLNEWGFDDPPTNFFLPIASTLFIFKDLIKNPDSLKMLKLWYACNTLTIEAPKSNNHKLGLDFKTLCDYFTERMENKKNFAFPFQKISINANDLIEAPQNSVLFKNALSLLKQDATKIDFFSDEKIEKEDAHIHYIFKRVKKADPDNKKIESLVNKIFVSKKISEEYKTKILPEIYLSTFLQKYKDKSRIDRRIKLLTSLSTFII